jgi:hypothetical protein
VIEQMVGTTTREAQKVTLSLSSNEVPVKPDKLKQVTKNQIEVRFTAREELQVKTEKLRGFLAHSHPGISLGELYEKLCDLGIEQWDPSRPPKRSTKKDAAKQKREEKIIEDKIIQQKVNEQQGEDQQELGVLNQKEFGAPRKSCVRNVCIRNREPSSSNEPNESNELKESNEPNESKKSVEFHEAESAASKNKSQAQVRREAFQRAESKCENCGSGYALEIDHRIPQALGGSSDPENLRVLCKHCNQRAAIDVFGQQKMDIYLSP